MSNSLSDTDWDDVDVAQSPAIEAARLLHTARQMVDTSRWWLMRWPRNATALLVRAAFGGMEGDVRMMREAAAVWHHRLRGEARHGGDALLHEGLERSFVEPAGALRVERLQP